MSACAEVMNRFKKNKNIKELYVRMVEKRLHFQENTYETNTCILKVYI